MKKALKKAFTLVELLVVIAIVAVLTVAGIVAYSAFTKKAEISNDESLVSQLNTLMQGYEALNGGKVLQPNEAIAALKEEGFDLAKLHTAYKGHRIVFDPSTCQFLLIENGDKSYPEGSFLMLPEPSDSATAAEIQQQMRDVMGEDADIGLYIPDSVANTMSGKASLPDAYEVSDSIDAPHLTAQVKYSDTKEETITVNCGNDDEMTDQQYADVLNRLTIDNSQATVNHYGYVKDVDVGDVKEYHCYAERSGAFTIRGSGTFIFEEGSACNEGWTWRRNQGKKDSTLGTNFYIDPSTTGGERNITIEFKEKIGKTPVSGSPITLTIFIDDGLTDKVNLTIINKGAEEGSALVINHKGGQTTIDSENFSGTIENGVFTKASPASLSISTCSYETSLLPTNADQEDPNVAWSTWKHGETVVGRYYYTASEFAAATNQTSNPLWGGNCDPTPGATTTVTLLADATLERNVTVGSVGMPTELKVILDLNGHTLKFDSTTLASYQIMAETNKSIDFTVVNSNPTQGGGIVGNDAYNTFVVYQGNSLTLSQVNYQSGQCAVYVTGEDATVNVEEYSQITATNYCIGTNASTNKNFNVKINVYDSTLISTGTGILCNVPGEIDIAGCSITGAAQAVFARAGEFTIDDTDLYLVADSVPEDQIPPTYFDNRTWGSGNVANLAPLTIGNKSTSEGYQHSVSVELFGCRFHTLTIGEDVYPAIYVWSNNTEGNGVTLTYDTACQFNGGKIVLGGTPVAALGEDNYGLFNLTVNGTSYAGQQGPIILED